MFYAVSAQAMKQVIDWLKNHCQAFA